MKFDPAPIPGVTVVSQTPMSDERGSFARSFCAIEFQDAGLALNVVQTNVSHNIRKGTLRGMHYQAEPYPETKLVSCTRGAIFDVAVDLRTESPTYKQWFGVELSAENAKSLYIPPGCAHGFLTLDDDTLVNYLMGEYFHDGYGRGVRWNDPQFAIQWPEEPTTMSERDAAYPDFTPES